MSNLAQSLIKSHQAIQKNDPVQEMARLISDRQMNIALANIIDHPKNRTVNDEKVKEYAESIKEIGLIDNPVVTPVANGKYMILSGHHRVRACRLLAQTDHSYDVICCKVVDKDDIDSELILLHGNIKNNPLTPYEKMMAIGREEELLKKKGEKGTLRTVIAQNTGLKSTQVQTNLTVYKKAVPEVKLALKNGQITLEKARSIAILPPEKQKEHMAASANEKTEYKSNEVKQLEEIIHKLTKMQKMIDSFHPTSSMVSDHYPLKNEPLNGIMKKLEATGICLKVYIEELDKELKEFMEVQAAEGTINCKVCPYRIEHECGLRVKYGNGLVDTLISDTFVNYWCPRLSHPV